MKNLTEEYNKNTNELYYLVAKEVTLQNLLSLIISETTVEAWLLWIPEFQDYVQVSTTDLESVVSKAVMRGDEYQAIITIFNVTRYAYVSLENKFENGYWRRI